MALYLTVCSGPRADTRRADKGGGAASQCRRASGLGMSTTTRRSAPDATYESLARAIARALADWWLRTNPTDPQLRQ